MFGGVAIGLTLGAGLLVFGSGREMAVLLVCAALIFATGLADDIFVFKASTKLVVQIALASVLLAFGFRLNWTVSLTLDTMLTLVWVVGMTNAFNLLDNMDGLCAGIALIVGTALLVNLMPVDAGTEPFFQAQYLALLLGAIAGFLVYNVASGLDLHGRQRQPAARVELRRADAQPRAARRRQVRTRSRSSPRRSWCC